MNCICVHIPTGSYDQISLGGDVRFGLLYEQSNKAVESHDDSQQMCGPQGREMLLDICPHYFDKHPAVGHEKDTACKP